MSNSAHKIYRVLEKELTAEYRTRYAVNAMLLFCVTCVAVVSFSLGGGIRDTRVQSALVWVVVFFSAMSGLSRGFVKEFEVGTIQLLRVTSEPAPVFFGKAIFNLVLLLGVQALLCFLFIIFLGIEIKNPIMYALCAILSSISVSILCTLISAIVSGARVRGTLFPILSFPVLLPVFATSVRATKLALEGAALAANSDVIYFLAAYAGASIIVSWVLFDFLFYD